ncbi:MAG TPA: 23S rRNA (adenine(2503)-C(2))-methyltransferase RlmN [bacterium]|nr:23S rRNA (adenine(2503)-C(2))-methyltransferase RlmN [bacterium]HPL95634.1 23S rRNA (adenine(2503)-C(2))-methyltransferase RlmN [bacterium]
MNFTALEKFIATLPRYRAAQINAAIFNLLLTDWTLASNLPLSLRQKLNTVFPLNLQAKIFNSPPNSQKALLTLNDGLLVETVLMRHPNRQTVCLSSAVGCPLNCVFCATGQQGFKRNLTTGEIVAQALFWARLLKKEHQKITNLVFMGMGEPLLNYQAVMTAIRIFNNPKQFGFGARRLSLSTVGIPDKIKKIAADALPINLAFSLHAPEEKLRQELIPYNKKYSLKENLAALTFYYQKTKRQIMIEYLMLKNINDSTAHALQLVNLLKKYPADFFVNLITYNYTPHQKNLKPSPPTAIKNFLTILKKHHLKAGARYRFGASLSAACGQLTGQI